MNVDITDLPDPSDLETEDEPETVRPDTGPLPVEDGEAETAAGTEP